MRKNSLFINILFLSFTGLIVKLLGMFNKILTIRLLGINGMSLYTLSLPTIMMFITLAEFNFPLTLSKLISENKTKRVYSNRGFIKSSLKIGFLISSILAICLLVLIYPITKYWLVNDDLKVILLSSIPLIYLVMISGILKGYLNGNDLINVSSLGVMIEQIIRICSSVFVLIYFRNLPMSNLVALLVISMSLGEIASILFLTLRISRMTKIFCKSKEVVDYRKDILKISFPESTTRLIFSLSNFIEPILYSFALRKIGYSLNDISFYITSITGYAIPLLLLFSFLNQAITNSFIPTLSKNYKKDISIFRKNLCTLTLANGIIGGLTSILILLYASDLSQLIYGNTYGANAAFLLAIPFVFYFLQSGLHIGIIIIGENKKMLILNIISTLIKLILIYIFTIQSSINIYGLILSLSISIIFTFFAYYILLNKSIGYKQDGAFRIALLILLPILYKRYLINEISPIFGITTIISLYLLLTIIFFRKTFKTFYNN